MLKILSRIWPKYLYQYWVVFCVFFTCTVILEKIGIIVSENPSFTNNNQREFIFQNNCRPISSQQTDHVTSQPVARLCTHEERKNHVKKVCSSLGEHSKQMHGHSRILVDDKRKLVFCEVSKSGCTTIKFIWEHANNETLAERLLKGNLVDVHLKSNEEKAGIMSSYSWNSEWTKNNYTSFIVVRNPLDRVVSAYYNIIHWRSSQPGPDKCVYEDIIKRFNVSKENLTFSQFVEYITNSSEPHYSDRHWISFVETCGICSYPYDYIIRLETLNHDAGPILNMLGYEKDYIKKQPKFNSMVRQSSTNETTIKKNEGIVQENLEEDVMGKRATDTRNVNPGKLKSFSSPGGNNMRMLPFNEFYLQEFKSLSVDLWFKLVSRYKTDMDILGYSLSEVKTNTYCSVKTSSNDVCC